MKRTGKVSDQFTLPVSDSDFRDPDPPDIVGYRFWEKVYFRDGRSVEADGRTSTTGSDGPRNAVCDGHDNLYDEANRQGIPYIRRIGDCEYAISRDDLRQDGVFYEWTGPSPILHLNTGEKSEP